MKAALYFTVTKSYIDVAKVFFKSFLQFNKEDIYEYHVYVTEPDIDLAPLRALLPNLYKHEAEIISLPNTQSVKDGFSTSEHNPLFTSYISALDELLGYNYDLIIHLDLDMLCVGSIYEKLVELTKTEDWQIAGAVEQFSLYRGYFQANIGYKCPYTIEDGRKVNFGFVVFNPKTTYRNHKERFLEWASQFNTPLYNLDEVFFSWLYQKKIDLINLVYLDWVIGDKSDPKIIHFAGTVHNKPYNKIGTKKEYFLWLPLYYYFAKQAECSEELLEELKKKLILFNGKVFTKYPNTGVSCYERRLLNLLPVNDVFKLFPQPVGERADMSSCIFACAANYNYIDAVYVMLYSLFEYNSVPLVHVYLINESEEKRANAEQKLQQISKNIKVISYSYHSGKENYLHFNRDFVDCKLAILDELTPIYKYTFMLDCDLLIQGSFKELLGVMYLSDKKIFGAKDICLLDKVDLTRRNYDHYINGGFIIYKQGSYGFKKNYEEWLENHQDTNIGKFNEQDFINDFYQDDIQYISRTYNYSVYWLTEEYIEAPKVIHYLGAGKPFMDLDNSRSNFLDIELSGGYCVKPLTKYYSLYYWYTNKLKPYLSENFLHKCSEVAESSKIKKFNQLFLRSIMGA